LEVSEFSWGLLITSTGLKITSCCCPKRLLYARNSGSSASVLLLKHEGDGNTKLFLLQACHHRCKILINHLSHMGGSVVDEAGKAQLLFEHFDSILGTYQDRPVCIDFTILNLPTLQLSTLDRCFSEEEIWQVIRALPLDKALGPDSFSGLFYQKAWPVIKHDIMNAFHDLWSKDFRNFYLLNQVYMILLRKCRDAKMVQDFRSISLIQSFGKLVTKVLAMQLAPFMDSLVMPNQSAFIKGRALHDNFRTVHLTAKLLQKPLIHSDGLSCWSCITI
jgi:hypothetical protein